MLPMSCPCNAHVKQGGVLLNAPSGRAVSFIHANASGGASNRRSTAPGKEKHDDHESEPEEGNEDPCDSPFYLPDITLSGANGSMRGRGSSLKLPAM